MIKEAIAKLVEKKNLNFAEAEGAFEDIFEKRATPVQIAAFLAALKVKGEVEEEIYAAAKVIRSKANKINVRGDFIGIEDKDEVIADTCGTGGSGIDKFNISSCVAFIVAASGIKVAKHGNRAMSSTSGSADVFKELGIKVDIAPAVMEEALKKIGIGFLYAPLYHPALNEVATIRREMGIRTIFNILGPLCNPAGTTHQLLGVYDKGLIFLVARVLKDLGLKKAFVVHSEDLKDEVSLGAPTHVSFLNNTKIKNLIIRPSCFGLGKVKPKDLEAKNPAESAMIISQILDGKKGPCRDVALANASCCFFLLGKVKNLKEGVKLGAYLVDENKAKSKFLALKEFVGKYA